MRRTHRAKPLLTISLSLLVATGLAAQEPTSCVTDREALLALDQDSFDQDLEGGWRPIANTKGCELAAADLIRDYRELHYPQGLRGPAGNGNIEILFWHEGQVRAMANQSQEAVTLFEQSFDSTSQPDWAEYAKATIAFLRQDRKALEAARVALLDLPEPEGWAERVQEMKEQYGFDMKWPSNLGVVDALLRCFDRPYSDAYGQECRAEP